MAWEADWLIETAIVARHRAVGGAGDADLAVVGRTRRGERAPLGEHRLHRGRVLVVRRFEGALVEGDGARGGDGQAGGLPRRPVRPRARLPDGMTDDGEHLLRQLGQRRLAVERSGRVGRLVVRRIGRDAGEHRVGRADEGRHLAHHLGAIGRDGERHRRGAHLGQVHTEAREQAGHGIGRRGHLEAPGPPDGDDGVLGGGRRLQRAEGRAGEGLRVDRGGSGRTRVVRGHLAARTGWCRPGAPSR